MTLATADIVRLREARPSDEFQLLSPAAWGDREPPRRDWMVERCFVRGSVALLTGSGGQGKSLLMQQLLTCTVLGRSFLGLKTEPGRAVFFGAEDDDDELWRRQWDINRLLGTNMYDVDEAGLRLAPRVGRNNALAELCRDKRLPQYWSMQPTTLFEKLLDRCLDVGISYVVIDTASQTFAGNQNDEVQVMQFVNMLRRLAVAIQGVVILVKHPSASGLANGTGESGSVQWRNAVRSHLYLFKDKAKGLLLSARKANYGPADLEIPLVWRQGAYVENMPEPAPAYGYRD